MTNNAPDYEDNLAFEPAKTAGTMETIARDGKAVAIRCNIDNQHYFDLALVDAPDKMDWYEAKIWCEEHYCRLPMKHELEFIAENFDAVNEALIKAGGEPLKNDWYWSSSEYSNYFVWGSTLGSSYGLIFTYKYNNYQYVRPVLAL